jgi:hypothetical protein
MENLTMYMDYPIHLPDSTEFRAYFFTNMYMNGIHAGIQAGHAAVEMSIEYNAIYEQWAADDKTVIVLNGGPQISLEHIFVDLAVYSRHITYEIDRVGIPMRMPVADFRESFDCLNGALTAVGIIVPDRLYMANKKGFEGIAESYSLAEMVIIDTLKRYPLAH